MQLERSEERICKFGKTERKKIPFKRFVLTRAVVASSLSSIAKGAEKRYESN